MKSTEGWWRSRNEFLEINFGAVSNFEKKMDMVTKSLSFYFVFLQMVLF